MKKQIKILVELQPFVCTNTPYKIIRLTGSPVVDLNTTGKAQFVRVGDFLTEEQAIAVANRREVEMTVIPRKD